MVLGITLILLSLCGLAYGFIKKDRKIITASIIGLTVIGIIYAVYSYLYSLTPY